MLGIDYTERMKELREENNYSQKEIPELLGIAQTTYSGYETGDRSIPIDFKFVSVIFIMFLQIIF